MSRILNLLAAASVCIALPASAHHVADDQRMAHHVADDQRVAEGDAPAKLQGTFKLQLDGDAKKELEEARKAAANAPEGEKEMAAAMLQMMEAVASITVTFTDAKMTMGIADKTETLDYAVVNKTDAAVTVKTTGGKAGEQGEGTFTVTFTKDGMTMTKEGDEQVLTFVRQ